MKQYETYKNSGVVWIGEIPVHWKLKRIKHTTYVKGRIGWKGLRSDEFLEESDSYVVTGTDFKEGAIKWDTCYQVPKERYDEDPFIQLKHDDLLITKDGTIGKIAVVKDMPKIATLNSGVFVTRPISDDYYAEYMYWVLVSEVFISFYDFNKSGSTIQHLYQNVFNEFKFTCPPLKEQNQIANYLNIKTEQLDTLIAKKEQLISLLQEERTAMINQAVTKGLELNVPMKDSGIDWLGEIPEHWVLKKLKYVCQLISDKTKEKPDYVLALENIQSWSEEIIGNPFENKMEGDSNLFQENDILFNKLRPYLAKVVKATRNGGCVGELLVLRPEKKICPNFLYRRLSSEMIITIVDGSTYGTKMPRASWDKFISNIEIGVPPREEQEQISDYIETKLNYSKSIVEKYQKEIELLKEYKTALISEVVTGKVDVREEVLN